MLYAISSILFPGSFGEAAFSVLISVVSYYHQLHLYKSPVTAEKCIGLYVCCPPAG